jgi:membrane protein implicated in regulation of membrane protease activity
MPWVYLLLALAAFAVAFIATSPWLAVLASLVALGFLAAWVMGLFAQRVGSRSRDETQMLDPQELRRLREQADARRAAAGHSGAEAAADRAPPGTTP